MVGLQDLARILEAQRFRLAGEKALQAEIAVALGAAGVACEREHRFTARDVVDVWCPPFAIEVKLQGAKRQIYRQCERYCAHPEVEGLILATTVTVNLGTLSKPCLVVNLGRAWL